MQSVENMLGFTPFKKRANKFNYVPRYYDPEKEAREQRRAELRGERAEDAAQEYRPGQYIRTQREARAAHRAARDDRGRMRVWVMIAAVVFVLLFVYLLYPRLASLFIEARRAPAAVESVEPGAGADGTLDQSGISETEWQAQPITVVPNDYEEE